MYADSYVMLPAEGIYDLGALKQFGDIIKSCHIYLIGYLPIVKFTEAREEESQLVTTFSVLDRKYDVFWPLPKDCTFHDTDGLYYVKDGVGNRTFPNEDLMQQRLNNESDVMNFEVKYIGQAYGKDGSRNALDRLRKHETLQKISLKGVPDGYKLSLLLLDIQSGNQLITSFRPNASNPNEGEQRIRAGLDKLFGTDEKERITLYEAALIRYFQPEFNKEFKNSFPSTRLSVLRDCYEKDFSAVVAEICIDELPFRLCSSAVAPTQHHIASHDLHEDTARRMFFNI